MYQIPMWALASMLGMQGAGFGMQGAGMLKAQPPQLPQEGMPPMGKTPVQMNNPYQNPMPLGMDPYSAMMQQQNMKPGLSSALRRYGGMYG